MDCWRADLLPLYHIARRSLCLSRRRLHRTTLLEDRPPTSSCRCGDCLYELIVLEHFLAWPLGAWHDTLYPACVPVFVLYWGREAGEQLQLRISFCGTNSLPNSCYAQGFDKIEPHWSLVTSLRISCRSSRWTKSDARL